MNRFEKGDVIIHKDTLERFVIINVIKGIDYYLYDIDSISMGGNNYSYNLETAIDRIFELDLNYLKRKRLEGLLK